MKNEFTPGLVSVIVASYNHATYLDKRISSLLNQSYRNVEIIIIDDCSTDNSLQILEKYEHLENIKLIKREKNGGWVEVSNQGVSFSIGEFILFANCDDYCDFNMIEKLVNGLFSSPNVGISYCRSLLIDENDKVIGNDYDGRDLDFRKKCVNDTLIDKNEMSKFLLHSCVIPNLSAAIFRKNYYIEVEGLNKSYKVCSDWDLFFRMVEKFDVFYISESHNYFRQHLKTIRSSTKNKLLYEEYLRLLLPRVKELKLKIVEKRKYRFQVINLWAEHLMDSSMVGVKDFIFHLKVVAKYDFISIFFLPSVLFIRLKQYLNKKL
jgi:glycosyltransferase involved in cell wall biosynthesis